MKKIILFIGIIAVIAAAGCAPRYPVTNVTTVDSRPTLSFTNAPEGSVVVVDNLTMGEASEFNGKPKVLVIEPGTHEIAIMQKDKIIFQQTIFIESEHKIINVH